MSSMHRAICTLVLLLVVASQALGVVHAATHGGFDASDCGLCATFAQPAAAIPDTGAVALSVSAHRPCIGCLPVAHAASGVPCNHQRGPPPRI